jgi:hypothetical protein
MENKAISIERFPANADRRVMVGIAQQYAAAIIRRGREATDPEFLGNIWAECGAYFVRDGQNFLILYRVGEIYVASHFAPETIRGGYRLLRKIAEAGLPICFAVPADLALDLARLGWVRLPAWANKIATAQGLPEGKEILIPRHLLKLAWSVFRSAGDIWQHRDMTPAVEVDPLTAERLLGLRDDQDRVNQDADREWDRATKLANFWPQCLQCLSA